MKEILTKLFGSYSWFGNLIKLKSIFDKYLPLVKEHVTKLEEIHQDLKTVKETVPTVREVSSLIDMRINSLLNKLHKSGVDTDVIIDVIAEEHKDEN